MTHVTVDRVSWFLRVVEIPEQRWQCRWGAEVFDEHGTLQAALDHIELLAASRYPASIFVHNLDGSVEARGEVLPLAAKSLPA